MDLIERVARAMYEAPYDDEPASVWPPRYQEDIDWWMTRAQIAVAVQDAILKAQQFEDAQQQVHRLGGSHDS